MSLDKEHRKESEGDSNRSRSSGRSSRSRRASDKPKSGDESSRGRRRASSGRRHEGVSETSRGVKRSRREAPKGDSSSKRVSRGKERRNSRRSSSKSKDSERDERKDVDSRAVRLQLILAMLGRPTNREDSGENEQLVHAIREETRPYRWGLFFSLLMMVTGAGNTVLSQGIFLLGAGMSAYFAPSKQRIVGLFPICLWLIGLWSLHAWLPLIEPMASEWRLDLAAARDLSLLPILGPNWGDHVASWMLLAAGIFLVLRVFTWRLRSESTVAVLWFLAGSVSLMSIGVMVANSFDWRFSFAPDSVTFTYFPNRNQTSILLAAGACLAAGVTLFHMVHLRFISAGFGLILSLISVSGLMQMHSRGGVIFLFFGLVTFVSLVALSSRRSSAIPWLKIGFPSLLLTATLFLLVDAGVRDRVLPMLRGDFSGMSDEFRFAVWSDTFGLIQGAPWGVGLGQFAAYIPQHLHEALSGKAVLHPESSWLWLMAELGVLGIILAGAALAWLVIKATFTLSRFPSPPRILVVVTLGMFFGHSLVDVGWHRPGISMISILLLGLVFRPGQGFKLTEQTKVRLALVRLSGVAFVVVGIVWVATSFVRIPVHPQIVSELATGDAVLAAEVGDPEAVLAATDPWIAVQPLSWQAHFTRANAYLRARGQDDRVAAGAFRLARFLEPNLAQLAFQEGDAWLARGNVSRAFNAWSRMLDRKSENDGELMNQIFVRTWENPRWRDPLIVLSETQPALRLKVYERVDLQTRFEMIRNDLEAEDLGLSFWETIPIAQRYEWLRMIGWEAFQGFVAENPAFAALLLEWPVQFQGLLGDLKFEEASALFVANTAIPEIPGDVTSQKLVSLERQYRNTPDDLFRGFLLVKKHLELEDERSALETIQILKERSRELPLFMNYWEGELERRFGNLENATTAWSRWLKNRDA